MNAIRLATRLATIGSLLAASVLVGVEGCAASGVSPGDGAPDSGNAGVPIYDGGTDYNNAADADVGPTCDDAGTPENCGSCGAACPGLGASGDNVKCDTTSEAKPFCTISCQGEHYDTDNDASNGCETEDTFLADGGALGNHTSDSALALGSFSCHDDSSAQNLTGLMPGDARVHEDPSVDGFSTSTGSAPDYYSLFGTGGTCDDDINMALTISGASDPTCYTLTAVTNKGTYTCTADGTGACSFSNGSGSYGDNSTIVMNVTRTCATPTPEAVSYTIVGHL